MIDLLWLASPRTDFAVQREPTAAAAAAAAAVVAEKVYGNGSGNLTKGNVAFAVIGKRKSGALICSRRVVTLSPVIVTQSNESVHT